MKFKLGDIVIFSETEEKKKAAIITRVWDDPTIVDLVVFEPASLENVVDLQKISSRAGIDTRSIEHVYRKG